MFFLCNFCGKKLRLVVSHFGFPFRMATRNKKGSAVKLLSVLPLKTSKTTKKAVVIVDDVKDTRPVDELMLRRRIDVATMRRISGAWGFLH